MASILDTPQEIFYLIAQYELDLLDLGALFWSCKTLNRRVGEDLPLQKLFLDNTHVMLRGPSGSSVRRKYVEEKTAYGIRCNDPDGVLMSFPKLTPKEILKVLKVANNRITRELNRQIIVDDILKADADKVLDFIIKSLIENATPEEKNSSINEILSLFFGSYLPDVSKLTKDGADAHINTIMTKKIMPVLLKYMHEHQSIVLASIITTSNYYLVSWSNSNLAPLDVLALLLRLFPTYPQYEFDLNAPISSDNHQSFAPGYLIHPLEFCVAINAADAFTFLRKNGSKLDKEAPYLPLALYNNRLNTTHLVQEIVANKYEINKPLPAYLQYVEATTILGWTLRYYKDSESTSRVDHWFIEYLLNNGAKLSKEEEEKYLNIEPTHWAYKAAHIAKQPTGYSTLPRRVKIDFGNRTSVQFQDPHLGYSLLLNSTGEFQCVKSGTYTGNWIPGNQKGTIVCKSTKKRQYISWGSYGYGGEEVVNDNSIFKFYVVLMYDDTIAVMLDNVPQDSYKDLWRVYQ